MERAAQVMTGIVAALHAWFMVLEMFLWTQPYGMKTFGLTVEQAQQTATLAMNQGLYNGFLSAGLIAGLVLGGATGHAFRVFFLGCVIAAGVFGAATVGIKILWVQALPAVIALALVFLAARRKAT